MYKLNVRIRLNAHEEAILASIRERLRADSDSEAVRHLLRGAALPQEPGARPSPYEGWTLVASGNDPMEGDWKRIREQVRPWREKVLWLADDNYNDFQA